MQGGQPHLASPAYPLQVAGAEVEYAAMAASSFHLSSVQAKPLQTLLATERDAHRRQRELVRASLFLCPGKAEVGDGPTAR
jgi:hypothetical protein